MPRTRQHGRAIRRRSPRLEPPEDNPKPQGKTQNPRERRPPPKTSRPEAREATGGPAPGGGQARRGGGAGRGGPTANNRQRPPPHNPGPQGNPPRTTHQQHANKQRNVQEGPTTWPENVPPFGVLVVPGYHYHQVMMTETKEKLPYGPDIGPI